MPVYFCVNFSVNCVATQDTIGTYPPTSCSCAFAMCVSCWKGWKADFHRSCHKELGGSEDHENSFCVFVLYVSVDSFSQRIRRSPCIGVVEKFFPWWVGFVVCRRVPTHRSLVGSLPWAIWQLSMILVVLLLEHCGWVASPDFGQGIFFLCSDFQG